MKKRFFGEISQESNNEINDDVLNNSRKYNFGKHESNKDSEKFSSISLTNEEKKDENFGFFMENINRLKSINFRSKSISPHKKVFSSFFRANSQDFVNKIKQSILEDTEDNCMEAVKNFRNYFPHNNIEYLIAKNSKKKNVSLMYSNNKKTISLFKPKNYNLLQNFSTTLILNEKCEEKFKQLEFMKKRKKNKNLFKDFAVLKKIVNKSRGNLFKKKTSLN